MDRVSVRIWFARIGPVPACQGVYGTKQLKGQGEEITPSKDGPSI